MSNAEIQVTKSEPTISGELQQARNKLYEARERLESLLGLIVGGGEIQERPPEPQFLIDQVIELNATAGEVLTLAARLTETMI